MFRFIDSQKKVTGAFTHPKTKVSYPDNFLSLASTEELAAIGIESFDPPAKESTETHYVQEIDEAPYVINTPKPAEVLIAEQRARLVPLSPAQTELVLHRCGLLDTVLAAVEAGDIELKIRWRKSTEFRRDNELLISMAKQLGISDEQLDDMFRLGATL